MATLSLECLRPLAHHCPTLRHLSLHLSPTVARDRATHDRDEIKDVVAFLEMREVTLHLGLPLPRSEDIQLVANLVRQAFPTKCKMACPYLTNFSRTNLGPDGMDNDPDAADILTPWKIRQSSTLQAWSSITAAMPKGGCSIELEGDYVSRRF